MLTQTPTPDPMTPSSKEGDQDDVGNDAHDVKGGQDNAKNLDAFEEVNTAAAFCKRHFLSITMGHFITQPRKLKK